MKVASLYGPVQEDLRLVEDALDQIKHVESFPALSKMLAHVLAGRVLVAPPLCTVGCIDGEHRQRGSRVQNPVIDERTALEGPLFA